MYTLDYFHQLLSRLHPQVTSGLISVVPVSQYLAFCSNKQPEHEQLQQVLQNVLSTIAGKQSLQVLMIPIQKQDSSWLGLFLVCGSRITNPQPLAVLYAIYFDPLSKMILPRIGDILNDSRFVSTQIVHQNSICSTLFPSDSGAWVYEFFEFALQFYETTIRQHGPTPLPNDVWNHLGRIDIKKRKDRHMHLINTNLNIGTSKQQISPNRNRNTGSSQPSTVKALIIKQQYMTSHQVEQYGAAFWNHGVDEHWNCLVYFSNDQLSKLGVKLGHLPVFSSAIKNRIAILESEKQRKINMKHLMPSSLAMENWSSDRKNAAQANSNLIIKQLPKILEEMNEGLVNLEVPCKLALLSLLCREHILLLGPPGSGKSFIAKRLLNQIDSNQKLFSLLMDKFTLPEQVFGPVSISGLKEDKFKRITDGYLPSSSVAFLDEIFKSNSAILNSLLSALNERVYYNGDCEMNIPLLLAIGASNELPGHDLQALYDRFMFRCWVKQVSGDDLLKVTRMAASRNSRSSGGGNAKHFLNWDAVAFTYLSATGRVKVPNYVHCFLRAMKEHLNRANMEISTRRLTKIVNILQVAAYSRRSLEVCLSDCVLIQFLVCDLPEQLSQVRQMYQTVVSELLNTYAIHDLLAMTCEDNIWLSEDDKTVIRDLCITSTPYQNSNRVSILSDHRSVIQSSESYEVISGVQYKVSARVKSNCALQLEIGVSPCDDTPPKSGVIVASQLDVNSTIILFSEGTFEDTLTDKEQLVGISLEGDDQLVQPGILAHLHSDFCILPCRIHGIQPNKSTLVVASSLNKQSEILTIGSSPEYIPIHCDFQYPSVTNADTVHPVKWFIKLITNKNGNNNNARLLCQDMAILPVNN